MDTLPPTTGPPFSIALGISIGLLASFIQSLGLTIQRKSHLQNESLPPLYRKPDYARPVWLIGFSIYFSFNILGSIFQIGALPLIILGPLGAISLLWNAILARFLLGDQFSLHLIFGTVFIGLGALLIGLFGLLPDQSNHHNLAQLIYLYSRTPFLIEIFLLVVIFTTVCSFAHFYESRLNQSLDSISLLTISPTIPNPSIHQQLSPIISHPGDQHESHQSPNPSNPLLSIASPHNYPSYAPHSTTSPPHLPSTRSLPTPFPQQRSVDTIDSHILPTPTYNHHHQNSATPFFRSSKQSDFNHHRHSSHPAQLSIVKHNVPVEDCPHELLYSTQKKIDQSKLMIGIAYGSTSGTLSGICLLFAKTGVELLIRTLSGIENEFCKIQTWLILLVLLISALLQLWYLNKALRLVNPTLICPLAFCFYNLSSIISSLVYYDQIKLLSAFQVIAISMGTTILLGGVWIVSIGTNTKSSSKILEEVKEDHEGFQEPMACEDEVTPLLRSSSRIEDLEDEEEEDNEENQVMLSQQPTDTAESFNQSRHLSDSHCCDDTALSRPRNQARLRRSLQLDSRTPTASNSHPFDHLIRQFVVDGHVTPVRGFSFGLGAASPGFAIRPKRRNNWISEPSNLAPNGSFDFNSYPASRRQQYRD